MNRRTILYKEDAEANHYCNPPHILQNDDYDLKYAEGLSQTAPTYTILGRIDGMSEDESKLTEVWIEDGQNKYKVSIENGGRFSHKVAKKGNYHVRIVLPFDAQVSLMSSYNGKGIAYSDGVGVDITNTEKQTIIEYDLQFEPYACDYRTIQFYKDYKIAVLTLKGKVVDQSGNPVPDLFVHLYPNTPGQNFTGWDYRVGKTNNSGEYDIDNLKPGQYILGINLGRTPPQDVP